MHISLFFQTITGCPRPSIALQVQNRGLKHQSFSNTDKLEVRFSLNNKGASILPQQFWIST